MPKVSNTDIYNQDENLSMEDYLLGTNNGTANKKTQTYSLGSIFSLFYNFLGFNAFLNTIDTTTYPIGTPGCFYVFDENDDLTSDFALSRKITFSATDTYNFNVASYFDIIVSSNKFLFKLINLEDKNNFVFLAPSNFVLGLTGTTFEVNVDLQEGLSNGTFVSNKRYLLVLEFASGIFNASDYDLTDFTNTSVNPFATLEDVINSNTINSIIIETGFTLIDQDLTINSGWNWRILSILYTNASSVVITIPFASSGNQRIDLIVANQSNTFERIAGTESVSNPTAPAIPSNKIAISFITVTDGVVGAPSDPILGTQFKKKTESLGFSDPYLSGTNAVIQLRPEGNSRYAFSNPGLISIDGFGTSLISGNPNAEAPYDGKDLFIENTGANAFTLIHDGTGLANSKFFFIDETNLVIPSGGKVWLKYGNPYCEVIFKSWGNTINSESRTIYNRWALTNLNEYYRSRYDYAGFNAEKIDYSTTFSAIIQIVASLSSAFYRTSKSKKISKIYVDGSYIASGITSLKLGVFAFQRATVTDTNFSAVNLINLGEFTITKTSGVVSQSWELTPSNIEIPTNYLVSCVLMKTGGTGSEVNIGIDFKIEDYAV